MRKLARSRIHFGVLGLVILVRPEAAKAHLVSTGLGPFYDGVTHLLVSPDDLLGVIALSLLAGLNSKGHGPRAVPYPAHRNRHSARLARPVRCIDS